MPTEKRMKYLAKQAKKLENQRTREERLVEVSKIRSKLDELGLTSSFPEIEKFNVILEDFLANGTAHVGVIPIEATNRELVYQLLNNKKFDIGAMLRATS